MNTLQEEYKDICFRYLAEFNIKHDYEMSEYELKNCWVAGRVGEIACINDMYLNFDDIRYDIDNKIPVHKIEDWYWNSVERAEMKIKYMNYENYCIGSPDPVSPEDLDEILKLRKKLQDAYGEFMRSIDQYREKDNTAFGIEDLEK